jgi:PAS domain S-box-containing protein
MEGVHKVLIVEDMPSDAELIEREIRKLMKEFVFRNVCTEDEFIEAIDNFQPDIILSDYSMPEFDGLTALKIAREKVPHTPVIIVTGSLNEDIAVECMRSGASDYVIKEFIKRLGQAVSNALDQARLRLEKIRTQEALIESEERHRSLFEDSIAMMLLIDLHDGQIIDANPASCVFYGYSRAEIKQMKISQICTMPEESLLEELEKIRLEKHLQFQHRLKDGTVRDVEIYNSQIKAFAKDVLHTIIHDITEKKRIEGELVAAKEKAEENDRLKTAFLHNISHEIRTPLNAIVGFSSLINDPNLTEDRRKEFTDIITLSSDQLLAIITDIIIVATLEAGQEKLNKKETDINQSLAAVYEQLCVKTLFPNITILYHSSIPDEEALVMTDRVKLMQVLTNLVGNALKFTTCGTVEFGCSLKNSKLLFFIKDSGIGIPRHLHDKIFDRFWQVDSNITREYGGTGLGLSISKAYVELMGGKIWLDSEPGKGSTFHFSLPYEPVVKVSLADPLLIKTIFGQSSFGKTILIAEDESNNFILIEEFLADYGFEIVRAENGLQAVNLCSSRSEINLVLMDIKMPVMDGIEATRQIKKIRPDLTVIAITAYAYEIDRKRLLECGCNDYIAKPLNKSELTLMLKRYL